MRFYTGTGQIAPAAEFQFTSTVLSQEIIYNVIDKIPGNIQICQLIFREMAVTHAAFFHNAAGRIITGKERSINFPESFLPEKEFQKPSYSFCCIPPVPVSGSDPIADLTGILCFIKVQDDADEPPAFL